MRNSWLRTNLNLVCTSARPPSDILYCECRADYARFSRRSNLTSFLAARTILLPPISSLGSSRASEPLKPVFVWSRANATYPYLARMLVFYDPSTLHHRITELLGSRLIPALECPERIENIVAAIERSTHTLVTIQSQFPDDPEFSVVQNLLEKSHDIEYINHLSTIFDRWSARGLIDSSDTILPECFPIHRLSRHQDGQNKLKSAPTDILARSGFYAFDLSAGVAEGTWRAALASANLAVIAAKHAATHTGKHSHSVLALCRPPGHHCTTRLAGGYCYINNAVMAVDALRKFHLPAAEPASPKIAILDLDFHHGNGTQDYFYCDKTVLYVSIHGQDEYPYYSGSASERGEGDGHGFNFNYPLPTGSTVEEYLAVLRAAIDAVVRYQASYLIVSLGFDTFHSDPLGGFGLDTENYHTIAKQVRGHAELLEIPSVILLEGGYVLDRLGPNMCSFLQGWEDAEASRGLPQDYAE